MDIHFTRSGNASHSSALGKKTALLALIAALVVGGLAVPAGADPPIAPDLSFEPGSVTVTPSLLVVGLPAQVDYNVTNHGERNAFDYTVTLWDGAVEVDKVSYSTLVVNGTPQSGSFNWTPTRSGTYDLRLQVWYGPTSAKLDQNWTDNNATVSVTVRSKPDIVLTEADLSFEAPDVEYVVDGQEVTVKADLENTGTADVTSCTVSLWEAAVGSAGELITQERGLEVPAEGHTLVNLTWNTTGWSGKRHVIVHVSQVMPLEETSSNNMASMDVKVHTQEDLVFEGTESRTIDTDFKVQFFITLKDSAVLTIRDPANVTVFQDFDEQYDIEVMDNARLVFEGGILSSELNFTVRLYGNARLVLRATSEPEPVGSSANLRVIGTGNSRLEVVDSTLYSPQVNLVGGSLAFSGSTVNATVLELTGVDTRVDNTTLTLNERLVVYGETSEFWDSAIVVERRYEAYGEALNKHPEIEDYEPGTFRVPGLEPALVVANGAVLNLYNVSVESLVIIESEGSTYWTDNRLGAEGRTSIINIHRYVRVTVVDWSGQVVEAAKVDVLDYFKEEVRNTGVTDSEGITSLTVRTDYVRESQRPFVGNLRMRASAYGEVSEDYRFSHNKYPEMDFPFNVLDVVVRMPPSPHPEEPGPDRTKLVDGDGQTIEGGTSSIDKTIIIDDATLLLKDTRFTFELEYDFQWFILVRGQSGVLKLDNASLESPYRFKIYLEEGGRLELADGSDMPRARVIAEDESSIAIFDSTFGGDIYAECDGVEMLHSDLQLTDSTIRAARVSIRGGFIHFSERVLIDADEVELSPQELTADYEFGKSLAGFRNLRSVVALPTYGWGPLDDYVAGSNVSHLWFRHLAVETNLTVRTDKLTMEDAFIWAGEVNIIVNKLLASDQARMDRTWVGGARLTLVSDDLRADHCSFSRVLDDFSDRDRIELYSVELPGIVCHGEATADRYWYLTVYGMDGAGSVRHGAVLEVVSTESGERLFPPPSMWNSPSSWTDEAAGKLTVAVKANHTDSTGDYYVGSIRFRLVYDKSEYEEDPVHTAWKQLNMKSDIVFTSAFEEIIESPTKDIEYALYNLTRTGSSTDLKLFNYTHEDQEAATLFLEESINETFDRVRPWEVVEGSTIQLQFHATQMINGVWEDLSDGQVIVYILHEYMNTTGGPNLNDPATITVGNETMELVWRVDLEPGNGGWGSLDVLIPEDTGSYVLYITIRGGAFDPIPKEVSEERMWHFNVVPPQNIEILTATITPPIIELGSLMTVSGMVVKKYGSRPVVPGAEITVTGEKGSGAGRTGSDGTFSIQIQAPFEARENLTLTITAIDPDTDETAKYTLEYSVRPPIEEPEEQDFNWGLLAAVLIVVVIGFSILVFGIVVYRRHYGDLVECGECGAFIPATSAACPKCGVEFETDLARCSECEAWIPADSTACPVCGTPFTIESLEEQVALEESKEEMAPVDEVTTSTSKLTPLTLDASTTDTRWDGDTQRRRRRIKKRVKKRLTVTDSAAGDLETGEPDDAKDLFVGEGAEPEATRLPGLEVDESSLSDDELSRLLPTEDMLKELMLTSEKAPSEGGEELEGDLLEEEAPEAGEPLTEGEEEPPEDLGEGPTDEELEEIPPPTEMEAGETELFPDTEPAEPTEPSEVEEEGLGEEEVPPDEAAEMPEGKELLSELGLVAGEVGEERPPSLDDDLDAGTEEDEGVLGSLLSEDSSREAPKLCPNCGGNWILYKDGEYTCRICGERW